MSVVNTLSLVFFHSDYCKIGNEVFCMERGGSNKFTKIFVQAPEYRNELVPGEGWFFSVADFDPIGPYDCRADAVEDAQLIYPWAE